MKALYRRIYLYTLAILLLSLILSGLSMGLFFNRREQGLVSRVFHHQVIFIRNEILRSEHRNPSELPGRLKELSQQLGWDIVYWRQGKLLYSSLKQPPSLNSLELPTEHRAWRRQIHMAPPYRPQLVMQLYPNHPNQGILWLQLRLLGLSRPFRGPLLSLLLLLLFLGLLLIPLTRYLLRPYRDLQAAIHGLSKGQFEHTLDVQKYPGFSELVLSFNLMQQRLHEMFQQKQRLVADVSHELRSPLTRMRVVMELMQDKDAPHEELAQKTIREIEELNRIIDDVLEISRLQLHALPLKVSEVDLTLLLFEIAEQHQEILEQKQLELKVQVPNASVQLKADARLLQRLFNNLFNNLVKYVPGPGQVELELQEQTDEVRLRLRDHGPGIPEAELQAIFTPFHRLDRSRSRRTGGVGLGLAIVWEIVQAHHGQIEVSSPPDGGLAFEIHLPRKQTQQEQPEPSAPSTKPESTN